jgi:FAD/FMN-containing dehydrogenase
MIAAESVRRSKGSWRWEHEPVGLSLAEELTEISGGAHVLTGAAEMAGYLTDWTRRYQGTASCVVRPGSADEVARVIRCCAARGVPVIPQGGNTSLVGGSVPPPGSTPGQGAGRHDGGGQQDSPDGDAAVLLSTRRLDALQSADRLAGHITVGAGATIASVRQRAAAAGLEYGIDLAARDSATVGGTIATNAGGIHTIRYGPTRAQLLGIAAVLADGSVLDNLSAPAAGSTGYDLAQLLAGSEGTLAVITAARLRLWPAEPVAAVLLAGTSGIEQAAQMCGQIRAQVPGLRAAEYFDAAGMDLVCRVTGLPSPPGSGHAGYLLAEVPGDALEAERLGRVRLPPDAAVAQDGRGRAALWAYRDRLTEAIAAAGIPHKIDVAVPVGALGAFRAELDEAVRTADRRADRGHGGREPQVIVFGHIGVGNLHVNVLGPDPGDDTVDEAVARLAAAHGGSVSAEHGIGRAKAGWLRWSRSDAEIAAMRAIKSALDPAGLLNPGVLFPAAAS